MAKNNKAFIIGSGPIRIGQACEFDYSGTQACKALKDLGYEVILANSNPATIMTDPNTADKTYICPLTYENMVKIIKKERPSYILTSFGGQTALNLSTQLYNNQILQKYNVKIAGTSIESIIESEDRIKFKEKMNQIRIRTPKACICSNIKDLESSNIPFPVLVRSSFALGGTNSTMFYTKKDLTRFILQNPGEHLVEELILGLQELEIEVVRDSVGNKIAVCYIENIDPVGVHTGDSICVSPFYTVPKNIQNKIKKQAFKIVDSINLIGACNVQFAYNKRNQDLCVIEINARTSRSSALASKATGFPIAYVATKLVMGVRLDEIPYKQNKTLLDYKPASDYYAVKYPKFNMEKFDKKDDCLGITMKATGEVLSFGKTVKEAMQKAKDSINEKTSSKSKKYWYKVPVAVDPTKCYYYSSILKGEKIDITNNKKVMIVGSGPNRIGQGIEFDYCCVHAVQSFRKLGYEVIMVNSNPETVSTDYNIADKLYFEPITKETILSIYEREKPEYIITNFGGQTSLNILKQLDLSKVKVLGIDQNILDKTEDRYQFAQLMDELHIPTPIGRYIKTKKEAEQVIKELGFPVIIRPSYIIGGSGIKVINTKKELLDTLKISNGMYIDQMMKDCLECEIDVLSDGTDYYFPDVIEQIDKSGIHSGYSRSILPSKQIKRTHIKQIKAYTDKIIKKLHIKGIMNIQFIIKGDTVFIIEINPRSSRTVPIISKTYNFDMIGASIKLMLGAKIKEIKKPKTHINYSSYKIPVFSWANFPNTKPKAGPEMYSTGEELKFIKHRKTIIKPLQKLYK